MNQENRRILRALGVAADGAMLLLALVLAYFIRFGLFRGEPGHAPLGDYFRVSVVIVPLLLILYGQRGLYGEARNRSFQKVVETLIVCNLFATLALAAAFFLIRNVDISRWVLAIFFVLGTFFVGLRRFLSLCLRRSRHRRGIGVRRVLLIGSGEAAQLYAEAIAADSTLGYSILGCVTDGTPPPGLPLLGSLWDLAALLEQTAPDEAVAALSVQETSAVSDVIDECEKAGIKLSLIPFYARHLPSQPQIDAVGGVPLINLRRIPLDNVVNAFFKRAMDIAGAGLLLLLLSPLMAFAAVGTRLSSPGPIIFRQVRVGLGNRPFTMLKFRSMRVNARQDTGWTTEDDPRKTRFGSFLRKFSIDELPQLINVLRGEMSLVGPRPELPHFVEQFRQTVPLYMVKHQVRPGITGWAQVNGLRGDTSIPDRIRHDIWYIENWSPLLDCKILLMTVTRAFINPEKLTR